MFLGNDSISAKFDGLFNRLLTMLLGLFLLITFYHIMYENNQITNVCINSCIYCYLSNSCISANIALCNYSLKMMYPNPPICQSFSFVSHFLYFVIINAGNVLVLFGTVLLITSPNQYTENIMSILSYMQ